MDISNPGNSIELIENYVSESYPDYLQYTNNPDSSITPFHFPPGHSIRICNFIDQLRKRSRSNLQVAKSTINRKRTRLLDASDDGRGGSKKVKESGSSGAGETDSEPENSLTISN